MNMKRKMTALVLALVLAVSVMPGARADGWAEPDVPDDVVWSGVTLDGRAVDSSTYGGQARVLIFFRANGNCLNSNNTLRALNAAAWRSERDVRVVAFGVGEHGESMDSVRAHTLAMRENYAPDADNVDFVPLADDVMWDYADRCGYGNSIIYAMVVVVDAENTIRCSWIAAYWDDYYQEAINYVLGRQVEPDEGGGPEIFPAPGGGQAQDGAEGEYGVTVTGTARYGYSLRAAELVNSLRSARGLKEMAVDGALTEAAMRRAAECAVFFGHTRPNGTEWRTLFPQGTAAAESIAAGQATPEQVMEGWTASPEDLENMTSQTLDAVGVGCFEKDGVLFWTVCYTGGGPAPEKAAGTDIRMSFTVPVTGAYFDLADWEETGTLMVGDTFETGIPYMNRGCGLKLLADGVEGLAVSEMGGAVTLSTDPLTVTAAAPGTSVVTLTAPDGDRASLTVLVVPVPSFTDVPPDAPYGDAVVWAVRNGVTTGTGDGSTFEPDRAVNRADLVTFLWRAMGSRGLPEDVVLPFGDVDPTLYGYAVNAMAWAVTLGITQGTNTERTEFSPARTCTRSQVITMLYRAIGEKAAGDSGFADVPADAFYADAVAWAVRQGIVSPGGLFGPEEPCGRADVVTYLYRALA